ncbi:P-loop containing nucleoside triphosphate hydrolase protein [Jackrogersella minutella]|nr:P-loop containing nucleoside triphosphate hydrolase protein [Jackrogersella minutella]
MASKKASIAVLGVTGAGKSTFIQTVTGRDDVIVGKGLKTQTIDISSYVFDYNGVCFELVDTPGFDDTELSSEEILEQLITYLASNYEKGHLLSGILYLHPIYYTRVQGSTMAQLRVFEQLCGPDFYQNIVLGTTFWETIDEQTAVERENEFYTTAGFFGDMKDLGAKTARIYRSRDSCLGALNMFAGNSFAALKVQEEISVNGTDIRSTTAMQALSEEASKLKIKQEEQLRIERDEAERKVRENEERIKAAEERRARVLEAERQEEEERCEQELQNLRLIQHSRVSLRHRGSILCDKACNQHIHSNAPRVTEYWKCRKCKVVTCEPCYNSGGKVAHYEWCPYQNLP